ncbi:SURF1 family protein [Epibacterium ulvae]|uniref:SURF1 family protein n=1 Tax=Epibacterium ulvae TaxID=1156985 RepID=UPI001BFC66C8|nr:SURF1 family protein [Epibacterium ulvae]MBT8153097.1 SURF1 family protein [Epibacterium ulvae]
MRAFWFLAIVGVLGCAILLSLGTWQLKRLNWKTAILAEIDANIAAAPIPLPDQIDPQQDKYRAVTATGTLLPGEIHVWTTFKAQGAGYRVIAPFETDTQGRILVDRGFVPTARKQDPRPLGETRLVGNLHWPDESSSFTPDPDRTGNVWYARDVDVLASELDTRPVLLVLREKPQDNAAPTPMPITTAGIPNNHLQYTITWFSLAAIWGGMTAYFLRRTGTQPKGSN